MLRKFLFRRLINLKVVLLLRLLLNLFRKMKISFRYNIRSIFKRFSSFKYISWRRMRSDRRTPRIGERGRPKSCRTFQIWDEQDLFLPALVFLTWQRNDPAFTILSNYLFNRIEKNWIANSGDGQNLIKFTSTILNTDIISFFSTFSQPRVESTKLIPDPRCCRVY